MLRLAHKPSNKVSPEWQRVLCLLSLSCFLQSSVAFADSSSAAESSSASSSESAPAEPPPPSQSLQSQAEQNPQQECQADDEKDNTPKWSKPLNDGPDQMFYFVQAVSGKKLKPITHDLLRGVTEVVIEENRIVFKRIDKEELSISADTTGGAKFYSDWEKSKVNLESKFGAQGKEFLKNIENVHLNNERIEVVRKGPELLLIDLGNRKLHQAFDLRSLRFRQISMLVDQSGEFPKLSDIEGVTAVIKAPGFSFPVEVKEFSKLRLKKENDITVGVSNPVPGALRVLFFMPAIFRFHFRLARKE